MQKANCYLLAGPNGAGKSENANVYIPHQISVFNGDLILQELQKKHPSIESVRLAGAVSQQLENKRYRALLLNEDFGFETNYSADLTTELVLQFKSEGYRINLVYFGMDDVNECLLRVNERKINGGHNVPKDVVEFNFEEGIKRIHNDLYLYDSILFAQAVEKETQLVALYQDGRELYKFDQTPFWFEKHFKARMEDYIWENDIGHSKGR